MLPVECIVISLFIISIILTIIIKCSKQEPIVHKFIIQVEEKNKNDNIKKQITELYNLINKEEEK